MTESAVSPILIDAVFKILKRKQAHASNYEQIN